MRLFDKLQKKQLIWSLRIFCLNIALQQFIGYKFEMLENPKQIICLFILVVLCSNSQIVVCCHVVAFCVVIFKFRKVTIWQ